MSDRDNKSRLLSLSVIVALVLWQVGAALFGRYMGAGGFLVASPVSVALRIIDLISKADFWLRVWFSFFRILTGFIAALITGAALAIAAASRTLVETLLWPYITVIKTTPVASFIILCLLWVGSANLSAVISFLMVLPVVYANLLEGIRGADRHLLEMAEVFRVGWVRRALYIYMPHLKPYIVSACAVALGTTWKSGIAAEVIGIPRGSIGEMLYEAKIYLSATDLFTWTVVIIIISVSFEKAFMALLRKFYDMIEGMGRVKPSMLANEASGGGEAYGVSSEGFAAVCDISDLAAFTADAGVKTSEDIVIRALSKSYGEKTVLSDFSTVIPGGGRVCVMGESGVGKTTLIRVLMGLTKPDSGSVEGMDGKKLSAVFQESRLCESLNSIANIRFVCGKSVSRARIAAHLSELGLNGSLNQPARELSGGMRRRVAIARAVLADGDILFLDEPFQGLDEANIAATAAYILRRAGGKTILMISHNREEAEMMGAQVLIMG